MVLMVDVENIIDRVARFISTHNLFYPDEKVLVAVSGGSDSVCLIHILCKLREQLRIKLHIAHLNHKLRGKEADKDAEYVVRLAKRLRIPITIDSRDVDNYRRQKHLSLEEAARELRYDFFAEVAEKEEADCVAVAHTRDDNVETILLHILRGSGIAGLRGLQAKSVLILGKNKIAINIVRPLLEVTREEARVYCTHFKLKPRFDPTNVSTKFTRNRIRLELLPILRTYNPKVDEALLRLAKLASDEVMFLDEYVAQMWSEIAEEYGNAVSLNVKKLTHLPVTLQRQLLRWAVKYLCGSTQDIESYHVEEMIKFIDKPAGKILCLPHGIRINTEYDKLVISAGDTNVNPFPKLEENSIKVPGETKMSGWLVKISVINETNNNYFEGNFIAKFDLDKTGRRLFMRARKRGDKFQPLGLNKFKSLREFMIDSKIPRGWRENIPLLCNDDDIIWVVGWRIDERFKITDSTKNILRVEFIRTL